MPQSAMPASTTLSVLPRWTIPPELPLEPGSRDPLGFQRYATYFADRLLPNLTVLTRRARYYAFLCWVLDEIATANEGRLLTGDGLVYEQYSEMVVRFERFLALAEARRHSPEESTACAWIGKRRSRALLRSGRRLLPLDLSLTVQEGTSGALADYRSSMQAMGLLSLQPSYLPDEVTEAGKELADLFRRGVKAAKAKRVSELCQDPDERLVRPEDLDTDGKRLCLSEISKDERAFLFRRLLENKHAPVVNEIGSLARPLRRSSEGDILLHYLESGARNGIAFDLRQVALHQTFGLACLSLFKGVRDAFHDVGQELRLVEILERQMESEGISQGSTIAGLTRGTQPVEAIRALAGDRSVWIQPSLRLLCWSGRQIQDRPALACPVPIDSVALPDMAGLVRARQGPLIGILVAVLERLLKDHERVFLSKLKQPWLSLEGETVRLLDSSNETGTGFPPTSIRLGALVSIMRDLEARHG